MMKQFYTLLITIGIVNISLAQVPANYYDSANGLTGYALKTELRNIITSGHNDQGYNALYTGYQTTHSDNIAEAGYENDNTVLLFYTENPNGNDSYSYNHGQDQCGNYNAEGVCHNREHIVPQSSFNSASPMQNDIHHVIPSDGFVNGQRGSLPFGIVGSANWTSQNGSKRGNSNTPGYSGLVFEPIDEFKGDIARALLYFAVRYQNTVDNYTSFDMFNGTEDQVFEDWAIDMLLDWHNNIDPVDAREIQRNDAAYNFQGNANPFVNHPEYVNLIWNPNPDTEAPSDPTNLMASNPSDTSIDLNWTASTDNIAVDSYDVYIDGVFSYNTGNTNVNTTATGLLPDTTYCFTIKAKDAAGNESGFSNESCETTTDNGTPVGDIDIFFSEYIEGSNSNKVLEIANFTGSDITNMSMYTLKLSTNGNPAWTTTYTFPSNASITNGNVYVIANGGADVCDSEYDDLNNAITSFNGNDAIGLFKNDVLIDILGELGNNDEYAENTTLVRKPTVARPTIIFNIAEWDSFPSNNCDDLGSHTQTLSIDDYTIENISFYPNPVKTSLNINFNNQETQIEIFDILGKRVYNTIIENSNSINLQNLKTGVYIIKFTQNNTSISKRLIKN